MANKKDEQKKEPEQMVDDDGVVILESNAHLIEDISPVSMRSAVYSSAATGKILYAPGVHSEYRYHHIATDTLPSQRESVSMFLKRSGWDRLDGVKVSTSPSASVWRIRNEDFDKIERRKADAKREQSKKTATAPSGLVGTSVKYETK